MSGFHEVRFPDNIAYGATGGPEFATTVVATGAGHEKRNVNWSEARGRWDVASGLKRQAQIDELIAFFRARRGRAYGFRFKAWTDYKATGQLLGTSDDVLTQIQLVKHYPSGSVIEVRTITKPVAGTVKVYLDGVEQLSGWSIDPTTGLVTFGTAPAGVEVTADFEFDVPVRFDTDHMAVTIENYRAAHLAADPDCRAQDLTRHFRLCPLEPFATVMPKLLTPAMRAHLDEETTQLAAIWRITRKDGQQFFFTDHDQDILFAGDNECTACRFDADSWDPGPSRRGDVSRALLYMDLRYDGSDSGTPDLELVDRTTSVGERHLGHLCTLLVWHEEDQVDDAERRRNDVIFAWQGNRNPFVDHPESVQRVWSDGCQ